MTHDHFEDQLSAYADGELEERAELETHLASCASCTARLVEYRAIGDSLRQRARAEPAPAALRARVEAAIGGAQAAAASPWARRRRPMWSPGVLAAAAAVVLAVGVGVSGWGRRDDSVSKEVLDSHVRSLAGDQAHLFDVQSTDQHTVKPWFSGKLDFAPHVVDFTPEGFPLLGGRVDFIEGRRVAALVYGRRLHKINVYEWPTGGNDTKTAGELRLGYSMLHWSHAGMMYWAVSDVGPPDLEELARNIDSISR
ncbi:MAG TPA: anti-sigma factor [Gemmatimonadaceae bacterium]|nr:anti-sigma factor [Gemmatimonadaceae bacterium]